MKNILKKVFCKHDYVKIGFTPVQEFGVMYSLRHYRCSKCGKQIDVDGRYDPYSR